MGRFAVVVLAVMLCAAAGLRADTTQPATLFDPARHMHVSEVRPGMKGYGLTVFQGTKIEKFDVEVIDVVKNFNPKYDAVLIRCLGDYLQHTGSIAGMSGSPIFLYDSQGHARMIGAFAYGWPLAKDPIAGVQPIEYMLALPPNNGAPNAGGAGDGAPDHAGESAAPRWTLDDAPPPWGRRTAAPIAPASGWEYAEPWSDREIRLEPLATPVMVGKMSPSAMRSLEPLFANSGLMLAEDGMGSGMASGDADPPLEPGSVLAVPLLTGDMELTAIGTCTEKIGDRIFGFGHPFMSEGRITLPMGSGSIATVVANLETSFKLGFLSHPSGTLSTDQTVGVSGSIGALPPMVPIEIRVVYEDGSIDQTYHFKAAVDPKVTPQMAAAAVSIAVTGDRDLPQYQTVDYDLNLDYANGQSLHLVNSSVNEGPTALVNDVTLATTTASDNPFQEVDLAKMTGTVRVSSQAREAEILSVMIPRSKYEPGESVKGFVSYQPFHAQESSLPIELKLPHDLPDGTYQLTVSDFDRYLDDERTASPFEFTADNIDELFAVLKYVGSVRHDAIYIRLVRRADGVAVGRTAMPLLPSNRRQVMMDSGRSDITAFVSSTVKVIPTDLVMDGSADFSITIERHGKVETSGPKGGKTETPPPAPADGKDAEAKPSDAPAQ
ncbi:MAG: hypothetical protein ABSF29_06470 [Tepidisphaeraceae bacterium]|jgi:hypothetical protein